MGKKKKSFLRGTLEKNKRGFGFVITEDKDDKEDIFIKAKNLGEAMNKDLVEVMLIDSYEQKGKREGIITGIIKRNISEVVGTFQKNKSFGFVVPSSKKINEDIFIRKKFFSGAQEGDKVVAKITSYPKGDSRAEGKISQVISKAGEPGGDIKAFIREYNLFKTFPSRVMAEAKAIENQIIKEEEIGNRKDLRGELVYTIDGSESKDFDDAVSCKILKNGNYLLGVHIADVTHYVADDGHMDKEALKRGNSVYIIDQVVPMLPVELSNGICSLNPKEDRLTLTCEMEIDKKGEVVAHKIYESIIQSKERLVYSDVSDIIEDKSEKLKNKYEHIYDNIMIMDKLAKILREKREDRGSLDFDLDETHIILDKKGQVESIGVADRRVANKLIEEFMLVANEVVAKDFFLKKAPFVYRIHERPSTEKLEELTVFLRGFGIGIKGGIDQITPKKLNEVLLKVKDKTYENVVNTVMLRAMQKAVYSTECEGHFGLALKYYCHFTSPIRRYPDLMIHRIIKSYLKNEVDKKLSKSYGKKSEEVAKIASQTERQAIEMEREAEKSKKAEYMSSRIGKSYDGVISGVTNFGIYVTLPNTVEGMIKLECLRDDYYDYEPSMYRVIGRQKKKIYALGDKIKITVDSVSLFDKEINFVETI